MLLLVFIFFPLTATGNDLPKTYNVSLSVYCENNDIKSEVVSYVSRELRSLGDVRITNVDVHYELSIIAVIIENKNSSNSQVVLSSMMMRRFPEETLKDCIFPLPPGMLQLYQFPKHYTHLGSVKNIPEIARQIVLTFEKEMLEKIGRSIEEQIRFYNKAMDELK